MHHHPNRPFVRRARAAIALGTALTLALAACGTTNTDDAEKLDPNVTPTVAATDDGCTDEVTTTSGPITLTDDLGRTVKLDGPATRVAALEWQQVEALLTLCVAPVAVADVEGYGTWVKAVDLPKDTKDVGGRSEPNINTLLKTQPDLVIVEVSEKDDPIIGQLEKKNVAVLATTGADAEDPIEHMVDTFELIAKATGRGERADSVVKEFRTALADGKAKLAKAPLDGKDFVYLDGWLQGGNVSLRPFGQGSLVGEIGEALGLTNAWTGPVDGAYGLGQTDIEGFADLSTTWVFHTGYDGPDPEAEDIMAALKANPIWKDLPAVKADRLRSFPPGTWTFGGPRSTQQIIDAYLAAVGA